MDAVCPAFRPKLEPGTVSNWAALACYWDNLTNVRIPANVRGIESFVDPRTLALESGLELRHVPKARWFSPSAGLKTVQFYIALMTADPEWIADHDWLLRELTELERQLKLAIEKESKFHLEMILS